MSASISSNDFSRLSIADRMQLIGCIWESIEAEQTPLPLTDSQRDELDRRLEEYEKSPNAGVPWGEVKKKLLNEL